MYHKTILENGLRLVTYPGKEKQSVALGIWTNVGSRFETPENSGISHFLEHLVFKGTKKYSCQEIKESIEGVGGSLNGFTAEEITCYLVKIPAAHLDLALDILADMVINPSLPQDELEKERTVVLEEIKMYKDHPQSYVYELLDKLLWPEHPLGMSILGTNESVASINREDLLAYKEKHYTPENMVVSAAGLLEHKGLSEKVSQKFSGINKTEVNTFKEFRNTQMAPQAKLLSKDTEQSHLVIGFPGFHKEHPLRYALSLLNVILGGNSSSRLFNEIREKRGLAYEIGSQAKFLKDTGAFIVHAGIDNQKVEETVRLIFQELKKIRSRAPSSSELKRAKEFLLGQMMLSLEDTLDQMFWIGEPTVTLNKTYALEEIIRLVKRITPANLKEVARDIFQKEKANIALIGPFKYGEAALLNWIKLR